MPDETEEDRSWLLEPPAAGDMHVHVELGEGVELDESLREALEGVVRAFYQGEVSGFAGDCSIRPPGCDPYWSCNPQEVSPCLVRTCILTDCKICANKSPAMW
jgi:hypothetical protein